MAGRARTSGRSSARRRPAVAAATATNSRCRSRRPRSARRHAQQLDVAAAASASSDERALGDLEHQASPGAPARLRSDSRMCCNSVRIDEVGRRQVHRHVHAQACACQSAQLGAARSSAPSASGHADAPVRSAIATNSDGGMRTEIRVMPSAPAPRRCGSCRRPGAASAGTPGAARRRHRVREVDADLEAPSLRFVFGPLGRIQWAAAPATADSIAASAQRSASAAMPRIQWRACDTHHHRGAAVRRPPCAAARVTTGAHSRASSGRPRWARRCRPSREPGRINARQQRLVALPPRQLTGNVRDQFVRETPAEPCGQLLQVGDAPA